MEISLLRCVVIKVLEITKIQVKSVKFVLSTGGR